MRRRSQHPWQKKKRSGEGEKKTVPDSQKNREEKEEEEGARYQLSERSAAAQQLLSGKVISEFSGPQGRKMKPVTGVSGIFPCTPGHTGAFFFFFFFPDPRGPSSGWNSFLFNAAGETVFCRPGDPSPPRPPPFPKARWVAGSSSSFLPSLLLLFFKGSFMTFSPLKTLSPPFPLSIVVAAADFGRGQKIKKEKWLRHAR